MKQSHVVVIGGGAAGTAAAYKLTNLGYRVTILEKESSLGGRIQSCSFRGVNYELGASFITRGLYPMTFDLLKATNLNRDLRVRKSRVAIVKSGKAKSATTGIKVTNLPKVLKLLLDSRKFTIKNMSAAKQYDTESVAQAFAGKRYRAFLEYLLQPTLNGYFYWKPERTSLAFLMILMGESFRKGKTYTLKNGLQKLPEALSAGSTVLLNAEVLSVQKSGNSYHIQVISESKKQILECDGLVCATTATVALKIISGLTPRQSSFLSAVGYSSTALVARSFNSTNITTPCALAFPRTENEYICSVTSDSVENKKREVVQTIKTYGSGEIGLELCQMTDKMITQKLTIPSIFGTQAVAQASHELKIKRWVEALPEYDVEYIKKLHQFIGGEKGTLVFAGDYMGGPYIEGALSSGIEAANRLDIQLTQQK